MEWYPSTWYGKLQSVDNTLRFFIMLSGIIFPCWHHDKALFGTNYKPETRQDNIKTRLWSNSTLRMQKGNITVIISPKRHKKTARFFRFLYKIGSLFHLSGNFFTRFIWKIGSLFLMANQYSLMASLFGVHHNAPRRCSRTQLAGYLRQTTSIKRFWERFAVSP